MKYTIFVPQDFNSYVVNTTLKNEFIYVANNATRQFKRFPADEVFCNINFRNNRFEIIMFGGKKVFSCEVSDYDIKNTKE